jgi:hypothetical protein
MGGDFIRAGRKFGLGMGWGHGSGVWKGEIVGTMIFNV